MKVYTRTGDQGTTSLFGGARVNKTDSRLEAYGTLDELNSVIGCLIAEIEDQTGGAAERAAFAIAATELAQLQAHLFVLGSHLAFGPTAETSERTQAQLPAIDDGLIAAMEAWMDRMSKDLAPLKNFVLPGGVKAAAAAHLARTVARRAERSTAHLAAEVASAPQVLKHLNRMNDYFFVLARYLNHLAEQPEPIWSGR